MTSQNSLQPLPVDWRPLRRILGQGFGVAVIFGGMVGVGILRLARNQLLARAPVALLVDLVPSDKVERLPEPQTEMFLDTTVTRLALAPFEASAVGKLCLALTRSAAASS